MSDMEDYAAMAAKRGLLSITILSASNLNATSKSDLACTVALGECTGSSPMLKNCGPNPSWNCSFPFNYEGEFICGFEITDGKDRKVIAVGETEVKEVIKNGDWEGVVKLEPRGLLKAKIFFQEAPPHKPDFVTVTIGSAASLTDHNCFKHKDPYVRVTLTGDQPHKETARVEVLDYTATWNADLIFDYRNEPNLKIEIFDHDKMSHDDLIGSSMFDLWRWRMNGDMQTRGKLPITNPKHEKIGDIHVVFRFWNKEEPLVEAAVFEEPIVAPVPERLPSVSSQSSSDYPPPIEEPQRIEEVVEVAKPPSRKVSSASSMDSNLRNNILGVADNALKDALDAARRARRAAEKARESVRDSGSSDAKIAADMADHYADEAERNSLKCKNVVDALKGSRNQPDLEKGADLAREHCNRAVRNADEAERAAKAAAKHAADEEARRAKAAARDAKDAYRECEGLKESHPAVPGLGELVDEARVAQKKAQEEAKHAARAAEACDETGLPLDALRDLEEDARKARRKAERADEEAHDALRRAKKLIRDRGRIDAKKDKLRQERELQRLKQLEDEQNRQRAREHELEMQRRAEEGGLDPSEIMMYNGAQAYSYHDPARKEMNGKQNMCGCGSSSNHRRDSSFESLVMNGISRTELHGMAGGDEMVVRKRGTEGSSVFKEAIPEIELEGEFKMNKRTSACWCFGCGCCRCMGEC